MQSQLAPFAWRQVANFLRREARNRIPLGKEDQIQSPGMTNMGAAWLPNSREFVFNSETGTNYGLWRTAASKGAVPNRLDLGIAAAQPTISRLGNRLAFAVIQFDLNIWRVDLKGPGKEPSHPIRFICGAPAGNMACTPLPLRRSDSALVS